MNIREFAKKCGISISAASRILNRSRKDSQASKETYDRVRQMAITLGYKPNYAAKTLHTHRSNCLGVIIGYPGVVNTISMIKEISELAYKRGISLAIATCKNDTRKEAKAFENMLYRGVDAIIWHPTFQRGKYKTNHVEKVLDKFSRRTPVVCLSFNEVPGIFKFSANGDEDASWAAKRQLKLGCKKFAVISGSFRVPMMTISNSAYVRTLINNGIAQENIAEITWDDPDADWESMRGTDGIWISYAFMLHAILPQLKQVCNLKDLNIDGQSFTQHYEFSQLIYHSYGKRFGDLFGSLQCHFLDAEEIAKRGAEIAIQAMKQPTIEPFVEHVEWQIANNCLFDSGNPFNLL